MTADILMKEAAGAGLDKYYLIIDEAHEFDAPTEYLLPTLLRHVGTSTYYPRFTVMSASISGFALLQSVHPPKWELCESLRFDSQMPNHRIRSPITLFTLNRVQAFCRSTVEAPFCPPLFSSGLLESQKTSL
jgi:hypothetical protein